MKLKSFASKIDEELYKRVKILSVNTGIKIQRLLDQAFRDLLKKDEKRNRRARKPHVVSLTASTTLTADQCGGAGYSYIINNAGATGAVVVTLAPARQGMQVHFSVKGAQNFDINPSGSEQILALTSGGGRAIRNAVVENYITLVCEADGYWTPKDRLGTWSDVG